MPDICVKFDKVKKSYDGKVFVVKELNLEIAQGEFITMLGPSGSGKTTCLMLLAGFEDITSGEIYVNGQPIRHTTPHKRNIGMVFQNYALFPHMTIAENLAYPLKFRKMTKAEKKSRVNKYLGLVELQSFAGRYPNQLSGGQKQRVALARALVYEPQLVLMDEPLGALDKNLREQMQYEIKKLHKMLGFTVIYVTHDQTEALTMSDRIAVFEQGVIQQISDPKTLYERPDNKFVAEFIGENNHLNGHITSHQDNGNVQVKVTATESVTALAVNLTSSDTEVYLSIRPEKVILNPDEHNIICDNRFEGIIKQIIYIGDHLRIYIRFLNDSAEFIIKQPNSFKFDELKEGQSVTLGWLSKDCRALRF
ncbi:MAG: ABC transporter ATP-binding protein [Cocleimonas sp.]|nr:ABC transporter ATP-binding protein [Cocleimonas sp.]